ncbi:MAG: hypothetical protein ACC707_03775 [Thiohalomonadales bacterium]
MTDRSFQITISGKLLTGFGRAQVMPNLAKVFKISEAKAKALLNGRKHILKKNIDALVAKKYQSALMKIGVDVSIEGSPQYDQGKTPPRVVSKAAIGKPSITNTGFSDKSKAADRGSVVVKNMSSHKLTAGRTLLDCPSQPVSLTNTVANTATRSASSPAKQSNAPLGSAGNHKLSPEGNQATIQSALAKYRAQIETKPLSPSKLQPNVPSKLPTADTGRKVGSTPRQSTALEDLQRLLEKSRNSRQVTKSTTLSPDQTQKLPNNLQPSKNAGIAYDKDKLAKLLEKTARPQKAKESDVELPSKPSLTDTVRLNSPPSVSAHANLAEQTKISARLKISPRPKSSPAIGLAIDSQTVPDKPPQTAVASLVQPISTDKSAPKLAPRQKGTGQKEKSDALLGRLVTDKEEEYTPFEQPTLLSCAICRQTQHTASHCLNCGSEFESVPDIAMTEDDLAATFGEGDYENTSLEKVLWPGVTVLLFLYTLIFVFNLPLITFWVPDDTFDNLIGVELKSACDEKEKCLQAVSEQLAGCIEKSGIYNFDPKLSKKLNMGTYLDRISVCIVDVNNNAYFGSGEHTPFKNLQ